MKRRGQQVTKITVGAIGGDGRDHDVAGLNLLGHHMHHPVVTRVQQHRHGRARHLRAGIDGAHVRLHEADTAHGFVHSGRAECAKASVLRGPRG
jgi:hypothetical protein